MGTKNGPACKSRPDPSSKRGRVFDLLDQNRGQIVSWQDIMAAYAGSDPPKKKHFHIGCGALTRLRDDYLLDIRSVGYGKWCLCGRWDDTVYFDYVAEQIS